MEEIVIFDFIESSQKRVEEVFLCFYYSICNNDVQNRFINMRINGELIPVIKSKWLDYHRTLPNLYPVYKDNGEEFKLNYETEYWQKYSEGFKKGYSDFTKSLREELPLDRNNKYMEQILIPIITEPIEVCFYDCRIIGVQEKIIKLETFYKCGIISGQVYRAWVYIVKANSLYKELIKKLFKDDLIIFKYAYTHNDFNLRKLLDQSGKDRFRDWSEIRLAIGSINLKKQVIKVNHIKDLFREEYQDGYMAFFEALKNESLTSHPRKSSPLLSESYKLNGYPVNSINVLLDVFVELKVFHTVANYGKLMNKSDALKVLRNFLGEYSEYKKATNPKTVQHFESDFFRILKKIKGDF